MRKDNEYDIITIDHWDAPTEDGAPLLTMPNVPAPLFNRAPRTIEPNKWNIMRKRCYRDADYKCQVCGNALGIKVIHAHELYSYDYVKKRAVFQRCVALDPLLHSVFIHSGRALTLHEGGDKNMTAKHLLAVAERGFAIIDKWNREHPERESLRVSDTYLNWANSPKLAGGMARLIDRYNIKFYRVPTKTFSAQYWNEWRLEYKDKLYAPLYNSLEDFLERNKNEKQ